MGILSFTDEQLRLYMVELEEWIILVMIRGMRIPGGI